MRHVSEKRFFNEIERVAGRRGPSAIEPVPEDAVPRDAARSTVPGTVRLDGAPGYPGLGDESYMAHSPLLSVALAGDSWQLHLFDERLLAFVPYDADAPFRPLERIVELFRRDGDPPGAGALLGYVTYELGERLVGLRPRPLDAPLALFFLHDRVARRTPTGWEVRSAGVPRQGDAGDLATWIRGLEREDHVEDSHAMLDYARVVHESLAGDAYLNAVRRVQEYIAAGDIYQANLTRMLTAALSAQPATYYRALRRSHAGPFGSYLVEPGGAAVLGISPELFLTVADRSVATQPIKGTRPRGRNAEEDRVLRETLLQSEKDAAELVMIVDLMRNDLGRVADFESVRVPALKTIDEHPTLFHLSGRVEAKLRAGATIWDLLVACLPAGSITGAPKRRAMEILQELEPHARGVYTGAMGLIDFTGRMTMNVAIRTMRVVGDRGYLGVGGGIVADSDPAAELAETMDKARAFFLPNRSMEAGRA